MNNVKWEAKLTIKGSIIESISMLNNIDLDLLDVNIARLILDYIDDNTDIYCDSVEFKTTKIDFSYKGE